MEEKKEIQMNKARIFDEQPNSIAIDDGRKFINEVFNVFWNRKRLNDAVAIAQQLFLMKN